MLTLTATAAYTVPGAVETVTVLCNATAGAFTATLPDATLNRDVVRTIVKTDAGANAVTVGTTSSQTILTTAGAATTAALAAQGNAITVVSNGANWIQIAKV